MPKILLHHSDGMYSTRLLSDAEATELEAQGTDVTSVEDRVLAAWHRHCEAGAAWQALWRAISNERYMRRRDRELMPLEDAEREIARLKGELESSERLRRHFEDEWLRATGRQRRTKHDDNDAYTCIFPQPGCSIDALESAEWRAAAAEILQKYNAKLGEGGCRHQGCCCGHTHLLIGPEKAAELRAAGFLVEEGTTCG
jgi:hypothetical protein